MALHNSKEDLWIVIRGHIYDVTEWQHDHPGGYRVLEKNGGKDCTKLFRNVGHSPDAVEMMDKFKIGKVVKYESKL